MGSTLKSVGDFFDPNAPAKAANKYEKQNVQRQLAELTAGGAAQGIQFGKSESELRRAIPLQRKAYQDARANTALMADRQRRTLMDRERETLAAGENQVFRGGGVGSNVSPLVTRGVRSDTTRAMQALDDMFARHFSQLNVDEADATSELYNRIAAVKGAQGNNAYQLGRDKANAIAGQQYIPSQGAGAWIEMGGKVAKTLGSFGVI